MEMGAFMDIKNESILLISPSIAIPGVIPSGKLIPIAILYIATVLEKKIKTHVLDLNIYKNKDISIEANEERNEMVRSCLRAINPDYVGVNCLFSAQIHSVLEIAAIVKKFNQNIKVIVGGMHPTLFARDILVNSKNIDYVILGEGEETINELIDAFNDQEQVYKIDGLAFRNNRGEIHVNERNKYIKKLDEIPIPAYHLFNLDDYRVDDVSSWHNPKKLDLSLTAPIMSSRSCPLRCNFCTVFQVMGKQYRSRSSSHVFDELKMLYDDYGIRQFDILDDNFTVSKKRTLEICDLIIKHKMNIQLRFVTGMMVGSLDEEVIDSLVEAGLSRALLAIESGSDYIRNKVIGKNLQTNKILEVVNCLNKYKDQVLVTGQFIIGLPEETHDTFKETYEFIRNLRIDDFTASIATPYPGTRLYDQCMKDNLLNFSPGEEWLQEGLFVKGADRFSDKGGETRFPIYIKPYDLDCVEVEEWAHKFEQLRKNKCDSFIKKYYKNE